MELFGINSAEFMVILLVCTLVLGPQNLANAMRMTTDGIAKLKDFSARLRLDSQTAKTATINPLGPVRTWQELNNVGKDLWDLDPRAAIRQAVQEEIAEWMKLSQNPAGEKTQDSSERKSESEKTGEIT